MAKKILGASIGNCVHVAGVIHFLNIAEQEGYETYFLGPAIDIDTLFREIEVYRPTIVGVSYRLTPENVSNLLDEILEKSKCLTYRPIWVFGGTWRVAEIAKKYNLFSFVSDGVDDINDSIRFLRGEKDVQRKKDYAQTLKERVIENAPYPLLRHHFGMPSLSSTIEGVRKIAAAKVVDIISLGTDQNAQQYFFKQSCMNKAYDGAGGVPVRNEEDFKALKMASQVGNYPLMRCYSGTEDVFQHAPMLIRTIKNAWAAIPMSWYSELDGRSDRTIERVLYESQQLMKWHAEQGVPVEVNEPHHWGLRDAHDVIPVVMAYISAYNAKKMGVKEYIAQYMFNNPNGVSFSSDLARVLAMVEIVELLEDGNFCVYRESRAGLALFSSDMDVAKGQLAASTFMQMVIKPHIIHVVASCEAEHIATPEDVISSCKIVKGVIKHTLEDDFSIDRDENILQRKNHLLKEARVVLDFINTQYNGYPDPLSNPEVLADCIRRGILDAPHILKNQKFQGTICTRFGSGGCEAYDKETGEILDETSRLQKLL